MSSSKIWVKAYIKGWSFEEDEKGNYTISAIISIPAKNLKNIKGECRILLEGNKGIFHILPVEDRCIKTDIENCKSAKRYIYIKLKVKKNEIARDSIRAVFKEKVRILLGACDTDGASTGEESICNFCIYGIEKLYKHSS